VASLAVLVWPLGRLWSRPTTRPALSSNSSAIGCRAYGLSFFSFDRSFDLSSKKNP
jgi:hypothetical protein